MFAIRRIRIVLGSVSFTLTEVRNISEFMQQDRRGKKTSNFV